MERINLSLTAKIEQSIISFIAPKLPKFIGPDTLTLIALIAAAGIGISYFYASSFKILYLIAAFLYFVHWFGDSLDGRIARERKIERPNYGYYLDHIVDSISVTLILSGLIFSVNTFVYSWVLTLSGFLLLMIHIFLKTNTTKKFEFSLGFIGPTEARIVGVIFSILLFFAGNTKFEINILNQLYNFYLLDILGMVFAILIWFVLTVNIISTAVKLDKEDRKKWEK